MRLISILIGLSFAVFSGCASAPATEEPTEIENREQSVEPEVDEVSLATPPKGFQVAKVLQTVALGDGYAVLLEDENDRIMPIFVGQTSAMAIHLRMQRRRYERPLTHDLLDDILKDLGAQVVKVHIDGLKSGVFVGTVFILKDGDVSKFDSRSSDAIALAVGNDAPIFVADEVVEKAGIPREELEKQMRAQPPEEPDTTTDPL